MRKQSTRKTKRAAGPVGPDELNEAVLAAQLAEEKTRRQRAEKAAAQVERLKRDLWGFVSEPAAPVWMTAKPPKSKGRFPGVPVLRVSDLHWAETVDPAQVGGVNAYNRDIAVERLQKLATTTIMLLKDFIALQRYPGIVVEFGGDMMSGDIHEELTETNWTTPLQALFELQNHLIGFLECLAGAFGTVYVPCVVGNHTRLTRKPHKKNAVYKTLDWALYQNLRAWFEAKAKPRAPWVIVHPADALDQQFKVYNLTFNQTHGDQFRGGGGIQGALSPWMIGDYRKRKRQEAIGSPYHYLMMSHWHSLAHVFGILVNGSVKGADEYSIGSNLGYEIAQQDLFIVSPDKGINFVCPVKLQDDPRASQGDWLQIPAADTWRPAAPTRSAS